MVTYPSVDVCITRIMVRNGVAGFSVPHNGVESCIRMHRGASDMCSRYGVARYTSIRSHASVHITAQRDAQSCNIIDIADSSHIARKTDRVHRAGADAVWGYILVAQNRANSDSRYYPGGMLYIRGRHVARRCLKPLSIWGRHVNTYTGELNELPASKRPRIA